MKQFLALLLVASASAACVDRLQWGRNYCWHGNQWACTSSRYCGRANPTHWFCSACPRMCGLCTDSCSAGQYLSGGKCYSCQAGKYGSGGSSTSCSTCNAGKYSNAGASSCTNCNAGKYSNSGSSSCTNCNAGKYSNSGSSSCTNCQAGKYSSSGWASCSNCAAGKFSATAASSCTNCAPGTYASNAGSSTCTNCADGTFAALSGRTSCQAHRTNCPAGEFIYLAGTRTTDSQCAWAHGCEEHKDQCDSQLRRSDSIGPNPTCQATDGKGEQIFKYTDFYGSDSSQTGCEWASTTVGEYLNENCQWKTSVKPISESAAYDRLYVKLAAFRYYNHEKISEGTADHLEDWMKVSLRTCETSSESSCGAWFETVILHGEFHSTPYQANVGDDRQYPWSHYGYATNVNSGHQIGQAGTYVPDSTTTTFISREAPHIGHKYVQAKVHIQNGDSTSNGWSGEYHFFDNFAVWGSCARDEEQGFCAAKLPVGAAAAAPAWSCDESKNWVNTNQGYSQISLTNYCPDCAGNPRYGGPNNKDNAIQYCKEQCDNRSGCQGFFFQTHGNGHEICGFYHYDFSGMSKSWHGHRNGAVCTKAAVPETADSSYGCECRAPYTCNDAACTECVAPQLSCPAQQFTNPTLSVFGTPSYDHTCEETASGGICEITCAPGFELATNSNGAIVTCDGFYGEWTPLTAAQAPNCVPKPCHTPESAEYTELRKVSFPANSHDWNNKADVMAATTVVGQMPQAISRVAYCMQLDDKWVWASFDEEDKLSIGVPVDAHHRMDGEVVNLKVYSTDSAVTNHNTPVVGKGEFWSSHYWFRDQNNQNRYVADHDDEPFKQEDQYGSMQIFDNSNKLVFGFSGFSDAKSANRDCGVQIGVGAPRNANWKDSTFNSNCKNYQNDVSGIRVFVKERTIAGQVELEVAMDLPASSTMTVNGKPQLTETAQIDLKTSIAASMGVTDLNLVLIELVPITGRRLLAGYRVKITILVPQDTLQGSVDAAVTEKVQGMAAAANSGALANALAAVPGVVVEEVQAVVAEDANGNPITLAPTPAPTAYPTPAPTPAPTSSCPVTCELEAVSGKGRSHTPDSTDPYNYANSNTHSEITDDGFKIKVTHDVNEINIYKGGQHVQSYMHHRCFRIAKTQTCTCECIGDASFFGEAKYGRNQNAPGVATGAESKVLNADTDYNPWNDNVDVSDTDSLAGFWASGNLPAATGKVGGYVNIQGASRTRSGN